MKNTQTQKKEKIKSIDSQHCVIGLTDQHILSKLAHCLLLSCELAGIKKLPMKLWQPELNNRGIIL